MAGIAHEIVIEVLKTHPEWLGLLLKVTVDTELPEPLTIIDTAVRFVKADEVRPDILLTSGQDGRWVLVEVQNEPDAAKQRRWLLASAVLLNERGAMGDLVVITTHRRVARWARTVARGTGPLGTRMSLTPVVVHLGAEEIERLLDPAHPELGFFAAWAVQERSGPKARAIVRRSIELAGALPVELQTPYIRAMLNMLSEPLAAYVRHMVMDPNRIPESPYGRRVREELEAIGEARGEARGRAAAILAVLASRGIEVDEATRARIFACTEPDKLDEWTRRAVTASSLAKVFDSSDLQ